MAQPPQILIDRIGAFPGGVDTNAPSRELPSQQLAFGLNASLRGQFAHTRPPFKIRTIIDPDGVISGLNGLFQGAAYYRPDGAPESLFASVSGRLFQFTPDSSGNAILKERTIPGDLNDQLVTQCWMWQAEQFLIVNDGKNYPLFFDGNTTRRSLGSNSQTVATTAAAFTAPAVGSDVGVQITSPYTFPLGLAATVNGKSYTVKSFSTSSGSLYNVKVKQTNKSVLAGAGQACLLRSPNAFVAYMNAVVDTTNWLVYTSGTTPSHTWPPTAAQLPIAAQYVKRITLSRPYTGALYGVLYVNGISKIGVLAIDGTKMILDVVSLSYTLNTAGAFNLFEGVGFA